MLFAFDVSLDESRERLRDEEVEEEDDGEEMAQSDIEIARDGENDIERDEESDRPLGYLGMETFEYRLPRVRSALSPERELRDTEEAVENREEEEREKGNGFFHEKNRGEIIGRGLGRNEISRRIVKERIVEEKDIAAGDPGEDDHDAEGVVGERFQYGDPLHVGDDIAREDFGRPVIIELLEGEGVHLLAGHIPDIREIDSIDRDEADEENRDIFLGIGGGEFQGLSP